MKTILLVDPDRTSGMICEFLNRGDYVSILAADAGTALATLRRGVPVDLIITELLLPDMEGTEFLSFLRRDFPGLPVLVLTGSASVQNYLQAMHLGVGDYLCKPVRSKELGRIVTMVFDRRLLPEAGSTNAN